MTKRKTKDNDSEHDCAIIIFVKNPVLGKAKTRLAESVGQQEALRIYQLLLAYTRRITSEVDATRYLYYADEIWEDEWSEQIFIKRLQHGIDLGERMFRAFEEVLSIHKKAVIIGSDCSRLTVDHIHEAFHILDKKEVVIGPTMDGGYYLLGLRHVETSFFENMTWSVNSVFRETLLRISEASLSYEVLPELSDIDTIEDWKRFGLE